MDNPSNQVPRNPATHLHVINLVIALIAGLISIVGGVYSLKANIFSGGSGSLQGTVLDEKIAKPLWHAAIEVSDLDGSLIDTADTDEDGGYLFKTLKKGSYTLKVSAPLHTVQAKTIKIEPKKTTLINFDLVPLSSELLTQAVQTNNFTNTPEMAAPYTSVRNSPNEAQANQQPASYPRRRFHRRSQPGEVTPNSNQSTGIPNDGTAGNSASSSSSIGSVLAQTGTQLVEEWLSKKSTNNTQ